jgi:hypothetical protein
MLGPTTECSERFAGAASMCNGMIPAPEVSSPRLPIPRPKNAAARSHQESVRLDQGRLGQSGTVSPGPIISAPLQFVLVPLSTP